MKQCIKCGESKPLSAFYKSGNTCKICRKIISHEHYIKNKESYKSRNYSWRASNPDKIKMIQSKHNKTCTRKVKSCMYSTNRRVQKLVSYNDLDWAEKLTIETLYTTAQKLGLHVDHIKPLSKGGLHTPSNLQLLSPEENMKKGAKYEGPT